jgi:hypothetical protein
VITLICTRLLTFLFAQLKDVSFIEQYALNLPKRCSKKAVSEGAVCRSLTTEKWIQADFWVRSFRLPSLKAELQIGEVLTDAPEPLHLRLWSRCCAFTPKHWDAHTIELEFWFCSNLQNWFAWRKLSNQQVAFCTRHFNYIQFWIHFVVSTFVQRKVWGFIVHFWLHRWGKCFLPGVFEFSACMFLTTDLLIRVCFGAHRDLLWVY